MLGVEELREAQRKWLVWGGGGGGGRQRRYKTRPRCPQQKRSRLETFAQRGKATRVAGGRGTGAFTDRLGRFQDAAQGAGGAGGAPSMCSLPGSVPGYRVVLGPGTRKGEWV